MRSRETKTMADTARSFLARDAGKSARFGRAGAPRNSGFGCLRTEEQYAASVGCSDRVSVCRGVVRTQLLAGSARSGWARRLSVKGCTSRFSRSEFYQDFCLAQSHQKAMCLRPNLSGYFKSRLQFWTSSEAHASLGKEFGVDPCGNNKTRVHRGFQRRRIRRVNGSGGSAAMLKWSAFQTSVMDTLE